MYYSVNPLLLIAQGYGGAPTKFLISLNALRSPISVTAKEKWGIESSSAEISNPNIRILKWILARTSESRWFHHAPAVLVNSIHFPHLETKRNHKINQETKTARRITDRSAKNQQNHHQETNGNLPNSPPRCDRQSRIRGSEVPALSSPWVPIGRRGLEPSCVPSGPGRSMRT